MKLPFEREQYNVDAPTVGQQARAAETSTLAFAQTANQLNQSGQEIFDTVIKVQADDEARIRADDFNDNLHNLKQTLINNSDDGNYRNEKWEYEQDTVFNRPKTVTDKFYELAENLHKTYKEGLSMPLSRDLFSQRTRDNFHTKLMSIREDELNLRYNSIKKQTQSEILGNSNKLASNPNMLFCTISMYP